MGRVSDAKKRLMDAVLELIWTGSYGSTTIDHICDKAGVKKGSFYYFFDSKADLATAALDEDWTMRRTQLDAAFSPTIPPLERLRRFCELPYKKQMELRERFGKVLGCPVFSLGCEVCTQEHKLQAKIQQILDYYRKYLESLIRDAHAAGVIHAPNSAEKARMIWAYHEGLMTQARIQNDVEVLRDMPRGVFAILGVNEPEAVTA
jgi:TetR/AcrR family transcriptional regulator, transcriptional repressor for nem operon